MLIANGLKLTAEGLKLIEEGSTLTAEDVLLSVAGGNNAAGSVKITQLMGTYQKFTNYNNTP
jgi:hypothetical protein